MRDPEAESPVLARRHPRKPNSRAYLAKMSVQSASNVFVITFGGRFYIVYRRLVSHFEENLSHLDRVRVWK